jgi:hypothetical protein
MRIKLKARNQTVMATIQETDKRYIFKFPYNKTLLKEVKNLGGTSWHPDTKHWEADKFSLRTQFMLGYLTDGELGTNVLDPYYQSIEPITLPDLYAHQNEMAAHLIQKKRIFWACDMGVGKTLAWIRSTEHIINQLGSDYGNLWVIAPKAPLKAWHYEIKKWNCKLPISFISCDQRKIEQAMENAVEPPQFLCIDEVSRFKNPTAKRTQLLLELSRLMYEHYQGNEYIAALSGTPAPKDPSDWWAPCEVLCPGFIQENSPKRVVDRS